MKGKDEKRVRVIEHLRPFEWLFLQRGLNCFSVGAGIVDGDRSPMINVNSDSYFV